MKKVAVVVQDGFESFGLGQMCEVFAEQYHPEDDNPVFDFGIVSATPGRVRGADFDIFVEHDLAWAADADLVCVIPKRDFRAPSPGVVELIRETHARGAWVFGHCTAAFILGEAGVLDGRRATTHWRYVDELADAYPGAEVDGNVLYVQAGNLVTGAGSAAGLDAALHVLRQEFGARVAASAARRMVVPPHREGGQAQYVARPVPVCESDTLAPLLAWIEQHLDQEITVESLARQVHMSPRTFARRFKEATGATPYSWILGQRVQTAQELLERSDESIESIARRVGFAGSAALRQHFGRVVGVSPQDYRRTFKAPARESA